MIPVRQGLETRALAPVRQLRRSLGKPDKDVKNPFGAYPEGTGRQFAWRAYARERLRTPYGAARRTS